MSIENLSNDKKETSIHFIVQQGVVNPAVRLANLKDRIKICDIRTAFYGINDCIFLGIIISVIFWLMFFQVDTKLIGCGVYLSSVRMLFFRWRWKTVISQLICSGVWVGAKVLFI